MFCVSCSCRNPSRLRPRFHPLACDRVPRFASVAAGAVLLAALAYLGPVPRWSTLKGGRRGNEGVRRQEGKLRDLPLAWRAFSLAFRVSVDDQMMGQQDRQCTERLTGTLLHQPLPLAPLSLSILPPGTRNLLRASHIFAAVLARRWSHFELAEVLDKL